MRFILLAVLALAPLFGYAADPNCTDLTTLQRAAGYVSWLGLIQVLGIGSIAGGVIFIFWGVIKTILDMTGLMEALLWILTVGLLTGTAFVDPTYQPWTLAIGAILIPCACLLTADLHKIKIEKTKSLATLTFIWVTIAIFYHSPFVGFLAVGALLAFLGFSMAVTPFCYSFGFTDEDAVPRATTAGLMVMAAYIALRAFRIDPGYFSVFESGALWLASFVGFLGLLITSSKWYEDAKHWAIMNTVTIVLLIGVTSLGMVFGIKEVTTIASTFLLFYLAAKIVEIETESLVAIGIKLLIVGLITAGAWQWLRTHQEFAMQYLTV